MNNISMIALAGTKFLELLCILAFFATIKLWTPKIGKLGFFILTVIPFLIGSDIISRLFYPYRIMISVALETLIGTLFLKLFFDIKITRSIVALQLFFIMVCGGKIISNMIVTGLLGLKNSSTTGYFLIEYLIVYAFVGLVIFLIRYIKLFADFPKNIQYQTLFSGGFFIGFTILIAWINAFYFDQITSTNLGRWILIFDIVLFLYLTMNLITTNRYYFLNKKLVATLHQKNQMLEAANHQLHEYASTIEDLSVMKERNRVAREVHDTLGQTLTILATILQSTIIALKNNPERIESNLTEANRVVKQGLIELRWSVSELTHDKAEPAIFLATLQRMFKEYGTLGLKIDFSYDESIASVSPRYYSVIYRICQEALTNSLKHGKTTEVTIILKIMNRKLKLYIVDNGVGCDTIDLSKGFGLMGMKQRIEELKGKAVFGSDGKRGFHINVEIPFEDEITG